MALKTLVKVGNITHLSDARYCSGMGVDMLGFTAVEGQPHYISPALYQEIRGWITGPNVVAVIYGMKADQSIDEIIQHYAPDFLEVTADQIEWASNSSLPLIVSVGSVSELSALSRYTEKIAYVQVTESDTEIMEKCSFPVICEIQSSQGVDHILENEKVKGIALSGSPETRPGFKDYGDLADVLERLEVD